VSRAWEDVPLIDAPADPSLEALREQARRIAVYEAKRLRLLDERNHLVGVARAAGKSWEEIAAASGVTRQALHKLRHGTRS
jgi:hypothetical protein